MLVQHHGEGYEQQHGGQQRGARGARGSAGTGQHLGVRMRIAWQHARRPVGPQRRASRRGQAPSADMNTQQHFLFKSSQVKSSCSAVSFLVRACVLSGVEILESQVKPPHLSLMTVMIHTRSVQKLRDIKQTRKAFRLRG